MKKRNTATPQYSLFIESMQRYNKERNGQFSYTLKFDFYRDTDLMNDARGNTDIPRNSLLFIGPMTNI